MSYRENSKYFQQALKIIETYINDIEYSVKEFLYTHLINGDLDDELIAHVMYIFDESAILPEMKEIFDYIVKEKDQKFMSGTIKYLYLRIENLKDIYFD